MRILVVDDEFVALNTLAKLLSDYGTCDMAQSSQEALTLFRDAYLDSNYYDLISIDIQMPQIDGLELLKLITREERSLLMMPSKKMMVTASGTAGNVMRAIENNADSFIVKPVKKDVLREKLQEINIR